MNGTVELITLISNKYHMSSLCINLISLQILLHSSCQELILLYFTLCHASDQMTYKSMKGYLWNDVNKSKLPCHSDRSTRDVPHSATCTYQKSDLHLTNRSDIDKEKMRWPYTCTLGVENISPLEP